jgi:tRNA threonylcarbamoyl adenosine modification protein (Sua5/YciO/YrdC/YwlC family)
MSEFRIEDTEPIAKLLLSGSVGVLPTDTVYGLVTCASNVAAAKLLYGLKSREQKPGTIIAANVGQLEALGLKRRYLKVVEQYWPASLSVVIPCGQDLEYLHQGAGGLAVRIPADKKLNNLLKLTGPLLTTSANAPGKPVANTIDEAKSFFGNNVSFYVDGGNLSNRKPSTIIRIVDDAIEVLRRGSVNVIEEIGEVEK